MFKPAADYRSVELTGCSSSLASRDQWRTAQHLAAWGNFGQTIRKNYPVLIGNRFRGAERELALVVGTLCTPLGLLADRMDLAKADVDDFVVVLQSGTYGPTASPTAFLSHPPPVEVLV